MDRYEEAVLDYITANSARFVSPQFHFPYENEMGGSCPDFVVIDFEDRTIFVVEVTSSSNINSLAERIDHRDTRWIKPLRKHFEALSPVLVAWEYRTTAFVREPNLESLRKRYESASDVTIKSIESISFPYSWEWVGEKAQNPLK